MVRRETVELIRLELELLSGQIGDPVPPFAFTPGTTSFFLHQDQTIYFGEDFVNHLEATGDVVDLAGLVAHEFWHWHQFANRLHPDRPDIREANARRFAQAWALQRFPGRRMELNFQDLLPAEGDLPKEPGVELDSQVVAGINLEEVLGLTPEDVLFFTESFMPIGRPPPISTAKWIRFKLQRNGAAYVYQMWREFQIFMLKFKFKAPTYNSFRRLVWILNQLQLVELVRVEDQDFGSRHFYDVVDGRAGDPAWNNPVSALYG